MRRPSVRMIRQPPEYVPADSAPADSRITHHGTAKPWWKPPTTSASTITPIVFCASCRPWPSAIAAAERVCACRNPTVNRRGRPLRKIHSTASISSPAEGEPDDR